MIACFFGLIVAQGGEGTAPGSSPQQASSPRHFSEWRGPNRDGHVPQELLFPTWPEKLRTRWTLWVGAGHSSPVADGEHAFVLTREGDEEVVRAVDLADGSVRWSSRRAAEIGVNPYAEAHGRWPRATPLVHDGRLYTLGNSAVVQCFDSRTGALHWCRDDFSSIDTSKLFCGTSASPLLASGCLIVYTGDDRGGVLRALDPATGEDRWTTDLEGPGYASPVLDSRGPEPTLVLLSESRALGITAATGALRWSYDFPDEWHENIVTPLLLGESDVLIAGVRRGTLRLRPPSERLPAGTSTPQGPVQVIWGHREPALYMSSPVLNGERVVALDPRRRGSLVSLDPSTGALREEGVQEVGENAALLVHGDHLVVLSTQSHLRVLRTTDGALLHTVADYPLGLESTWAHPLPIAGGILIKDAERLHCFTE